MKSFRAARVSKPVPLGSIKTDGDPLPMFAQPVSCLIRSATRCLPRVALLNRQRTLYKITWTWSFRAPLMDGRLK
jgi:hypothetical protein